MLGTFEHLFFWFLIYSFIGWVYESILVSILERRLINRGFVNGPLCPIYGAGAVLFIVFLGRIDNPLIVFVLAMLGASIMEYFTSWAMEKMFHARWWDYSNFKFNLNGRICLIGAIVFGLLGLFVVYVAHPYVAKWTDQIPEPMLAVIVVVALVLFIIDVVVTVTSLQQFDVMLEKAKAKLQEYAAAAGQSTSWEKIREWASSSREAFDGMKKSLSQIVNKQQERQIESFPRLTVSNKRSIVDFLRDLMKPKSGDAEE